MCGIVAVVPKLSTTAKHETIFEELMLVTTLRGRDSAGMFAVYQENWHKGKETFSCAVVKQIGSPQDLFDRKAYALIKQKHSKRALVGHCRSATRGAVSASNAHPFYFEEAGLCGIHNGTIRGRLKHEDYYGTDSEALYHEIIEDGALPVLSRTTGAWSLIWCDEENKTLNFVRNLERPMVCAEDTDGCIYIASEPMMLALVLSRNNVSYTAIKSVKPDILFSYHLVREEGQPLISVEPVVKKEKEVPLIADIPFLQKGAETTSSSGKTTTQADTSKSLDTNTPQTVTGSQTKVGTKTYRGYNKEVLSEARFRALIACGCAWCGVSPKGRSSYRWVDKESFLCEDCMRDDSILDNLVIFYNKSKKTLDNEKSNNTLRLPLEMGEGAKVLDLFDKNIIH